MTLGLVLLGYGLFIAFVLAILTVAKRADETADRWHAEARDAAVEVLPAQVALGRLVADVRRALEVERVAVVVSDPDEPATGLVGACAGAPGLVGSRVHLERRPAWGTAGAADPVLLGLAGEAGEWTFAHVPIAGAGELLGAVTVASRRPRRFTEGDLSFIEGLARERARQFDRRAHPRTPQAA